MPRKPRTRKRERKFVPQGRAYIAATFNNTLITLAGPDGEVIGSSSAGRVGFKGSRKATAFAAQRAGEDAARKAMEHGLRTVDVLVRGPGSGREAAIRALQGAGVRVMSIRDVTPV
ncbi:MAG: 30S ribosomal protein S11, partial [Gemmatimonadetes bacterium]|nr:30S ribosomal protein S11 [Gemmatimonadota bacterium]